MTNRGDEYLKEVEGRFLVKMPELIMHLKTKKKELLPKGNLLEIK